MTLHEGYMRRFRKGVRGRFKDIAITMIEWFFFRMSGKKWSLIPTSPTMYLSKDNPTSVLAPALMQDSKSVLHVGAHIGQERKVYASLGLEVLWIEGDPDIYKILLSNIEELPMQSAVCALLSDKEETERDFFRVSNEGLSSSLYRLDENQPFDIVETEVKKLQTTTLDSILLEDFDIPPYWIIDVQGAEMLVLKGAARALKKCKYLELEVSTFFHYSNQPLFFELEAFLDTQGFFPIWRPGPNYHGDVLFLKR